MSERNRGRRIEESGEEERKRCRMKEGGGGEGDKKR
jgi:hypothetical protein